MMNSQLHVTGKFWLADNSSDALGGYIEYAGDGPRIRLIGGFQGRIPLDDVIIHGKLTGQSPREVTLFNCFGGSSVTIVDGEREALETTLTSTLAVFGAHFRTYDDLTGIGIEFRLPHVASWFHQDCFNTDFNFETQKATITYTAYEEHPFQMEDNSTLTLVYKGGFVVGGWGMETLEIRRPLWLRISGSNALGYEELRTLAAWYRRLFCWMLDRPLPFIEFCLLRGSKEATIPFEYHRVVEGGIIDVREKGHFSFSDCLLEYPRMKAHFPTFVSSWYKLVQEQRDSLESFFGTLTRPSTGGENEFLSLCSACEQLLFKSSGREIKLGECIQTICESWKECFEFPPSGDLIGQIVNTRHYYAHRTHLRSERAARGFLLWRYIYFLQAIYSLELLRLLGIPREEIVDLIAYNYNLRGKLNRRFFPGIDDPSDSAQ